MKTTMTPQQAREHLADTSNFWDNEELCYVCGEDWSLGNEVEYNGIMFCRNRCFKNYRDIEKRAAQSEETRH